MQTAQMCLYGPWSEEHVHVQTQYMWQQESGQSDDSSAEDDFYDEENNDDVF